MFVLRIPLRPVYRLGYQSVFFLFFQLLALHPLCAQVKSVERNRISLRRALEKLENHYAAKLVYLDADITDQQVYPVVLSGNFEADLDEQLKPYHLVAKAISAKQFVITKLKSVKKPDPEREFWYSGKVYSTNDHIPLEYATVVALGTGHVAHTDQHGYFKIAVKKDEEVDFGYVGYQPQTLHASDETEQSIYLKPNQITLNNVQIFSNTDFIDYVKKADVSIDLQKAQIFQTGRSSLPQSLNFSYANINVGHYAIDNVASYLDPVRLNGQDADYIVVLIEGKKRHLFSGLNLNYTTGMGNSGVDLEAIPQNLLKTIEVIPADQSLLYGTEGAGGTINFKFDQTFRGLSYRQTAGITTRGDGFNTTHSILYGTALPWSKAAFFTFSAIYKNQQSTDRSSSYNGLVYRSAADTSQLGAFPNPVAKITENKRLDDSLVSAKKFNRNVSRFGDGKRHNISLWYNGSTPLGKNWKFYSFGGYTSRKVTTYGFYRFANDYKSSSPLFPDGYLPEDPAELRDIALTAGLTKKSLHGWEMDFSSSYGHNYFQSSTVNTVNPSMGRSSPTSFNLGGTRYGQLVNDFSLDKAFPYPEGLHLAKLELGAQHIHSNYAIVAGDTASYLDANPAGTIPAELKLSGTNGHLGFSEANAISKQRNQLAVFGKGDFTIDASTTAGIALRLQQTSLFGTHLSSSLELKRSISNTLTFHASYNQSARTPSLQQLYFSQTQYQFFPRNGISDVYKIMQVNSFSAVRDALGIPELKTEKIQDIHFSATYKKDNYSVWLSYNRTQIRDRLLTANLSSSANTEYLKLVTGTSIDAVQFFRNVPASHTNVLQLIGAYSLPLSGPQKEVVFEGHLAYNRTRMTIGKGNAYSDPASERIFAGIIEDGQPKVKAIAKVNYHAAAFNVYLRNTYFGSVWYRDSSSALDQYFGGKVITDLGASWNKNQHLLLTIAFNNMLNIYPDKVVENSSLNTNRTFGNQILYSRQTSQFGIYGTYITVSGSYKF